MFAVLLSVPLALVANAFLTDAAEHARERLQAQVRDLAGVTLSYDSMSLRVFGALAVNRVRVEIPAIGLEAEIGDVVLRYRLSQLLRGAGTDAIRSVRIRGGTVRIGGDAPAVVPEFLPSLPRTAVRDVAIVVDIPGLALEAQLERGRITPRTGDPSVSLQLSQLRAGQTPGDEAVSVERLAVDGAVSRNISFQADTSLRNARIAGVTVRRHRTLIAYDGTRLTATSVDTGLALAYDLWYRGADERFGGSLGFNQVIPSEVVALADNADPLLRDALAASWSGALEIAGSSEGFAASGRLDAVGRVGAFGTDPVSITANYQINDSLLRLDQLRLRQKSTSLSYTGSIDLQTLLPTGILSAAGPVLGQPSSLSLALSPAGNRVSVHSSALALAGRELGELTGWVRPGSLTSASLSLQLLPPEVPDEAQTEAPPGAEEDPEPAVAQAPEITITGSLETGERPRVDVELAVTELVGSQIPLVELFPWLPQPQAIAGLAFSGGARVTGPLSAPTVRNIQLSVTDLADPEARVAATGVAEPGSLRIEDIEGLYSGVSFAGSFRLNRGDQGSRTAGLDMVINGQPYSLAGTIAGRGDFVLQSPQGLMIRGSRLGTGFGAQLSASEFPIPANLATVSLDAEASAAIGEGSWSARLESLALRNWVPPTGAGAPISLSASADIGPDGVRIQDLSVEDRFSRLTGSAQIDFETDGPQATLILGAGSGEQWRGSAAVSGRELSASLGLESIPTERILGPRVTGRMSGTLVASGPLDSPRVELLVRDAPVELDGDPITLRGRATLDRQQLVLSDLFVRVVNTDYRTGTLSADLESGTLSGSVTVVQRNEPNAEDLEISVIGTIAGSEAAQTTAEAVQRVLTEPLSATVALDGIVGFPSLGTLWVFEIQRRADRTTVSGGPGNSVSGELRPDGSFTLLGRAPLPASFELSGTFRDGELQATISDVVVDLAAATEGSASESFAFTAGEIRGGLFVTGPIYDPSIAGTVDIVGVVVQSNLLPEAAELDDTFGVFRDSELTIGATEMLVGDGLASVTAEAFISRYQLERYGADVSMGRESPVPVDADFGPVALDGSVWGRIYVGFELEETSISGDITLEQTAVLLGETEVVPADDGSATLIDVAVRTGRGVEFYWPSRTIPVFRAFSTIGDSLTLQGNTATGEFAVTGTVGIRGGEIAYVDQNFLIRRGSLQLDETATDFDPRVSVEADIRDVYLGSPVTITLIATDSPLSALSPRFVSDPQLSEVEIAGILGGDLLAAVTADGADSGATNATELLGFGADLLGQFGVLSGLESSVRDTLGLDVFSIRTSLFENLVIGALSERDGVSPAPGADLGRFLDNTTLFVGRFLGQDVFLQGLVQLRSDGSDTVSEGFGLGGVQTAVEVSMEWQTPILDLEWTFAPSDPESLFVRDHRFAFSWQFAY